MTDDFSVFFGYKRQLRHKSGAFSELFNQILFCSVAMLRTCKRTFYNVIYLAVIIGGFLSDKHGLLSFVFKLDNFYFCIFMRNSGQPVPTAAVMLNILIIAHFHTKVKDGYFLSARVKNYSASEFFSP